MNLTEGTVGSNMVFMKRTCGKCGKDYFGLCPCSDTDRNRLDFMYITYQCISCKGTSFISNEHQGEVLYHNGIPYMCPNNGRKIIEMICIGADGFPDVHIPWFEAVGSRRIPR